MTFPNALAGVKKIYNAELLELIAAILAVVVGVAIACGSNLLGGIIAIVMAVALIAAFVLQIVGVKKAMPDEANFKTAFYVLIVGIVAGILVGVGKGSGILGDVGDTVQSICSFLAQWYIISAIVALAKRLGDSEMETRGLNTRKLVMIVWCVKIALEIVAIFVDSSEALTMVGGILAIAGGIVSIVAYVMYLLLLKKACVMLEK